MPVDHDYTAFDLTIDEDEFDDCQIAPVSSNSTVVVQPSQTPTCEHAVSALSRTEQQPGAGTASVTVASTSAPINVTVAPPSVLAQSRLSSNTSARTSKSNSTPFSQSMLYDADASMSLSPQRQESSLLALSSNDDAVSVPVRNSFVSISSLDESSSDPNATPSALLQQQQLQHTTLPPSIAASMPPLEPQTQTQSSSPLASMQPADDHQMCDNQRRPPLIHSQHHDNDVAFQAPESATEAVQQSDHASNDQPKTVESDTSTAAATQMQSNEDASLLQQRNDDTKSSPEWTTISHSSQESTPIEPLNLSPSPLAQSPELNDDASSNPSPVTLHSSPVLQHQMSLVLDSQLMDLPPDNEDVACVQQTLLPLMRVDESTSSPVDAPGVVASDEPQLALETVVDSQQASASQQQHNTAVPEAALNNQPDAALEFNAPTECEPPIASQTTVAALPHQCDDEQHAESELVRQLSRQSIASIFSDSSSSSSTIDVASPSVQMPQNQQCDESSVYDTSPAAVAASATVVATSNSRPIKRLCSVAPFNAVQSTSTTARNSPVSMQMQSRISTAATSARSTPNTDCSAESTVWHNKKRHRSGGKKRKHLVQRHIDTLQLDDSVVMSPVQHQAPESPSSSSAFEHDSPPHNKRRSGKKQKKSAAAIASAQKSPILIAVEAPAAVMHRVAQQQKRRKSTKKTKSSDAAATAATAVDKPQSTSKKSKDAAMSRQQSMTGFLVQSNAKSGSTRKESGKKRGRPVES